MKCPRCGGNIPAGAVNCGSCGARFKTEKCPHCGRSILAGSFVCPSCRKAIRTQVPVKAQKAPISGKKPLTQQSWFWTVVVVLVIGIAGNIFRAFFGADNPVSKDTPSSGLVASSTSDNPFFTAQAGKGDVMNGIKTEKIGEWGYITISKADAKAASMEDFLAFTDTFDGKGFNWCSILFEDGTGICFPGGTRIAALYGTCDNEGCITEAFGDIVLESDLKSYSYLPRSQDDEIKQGESTLIPKSFPKTASVLASETDRTPQRDNSKTDKRSGINNFDTYDNADQHNTNADYVLNTKSRKVHYPSCDSVKKIAPANYKEFFGTIDEALADDYSKCGICFK